MFHIIFLNIKSNIVLIIWQHVSLLQTSFGASPSKQNAFNTFSYTKRSPKSNGFKKSAPRATAVKKSPPLPRNQPTLLSMFGFQKK